VLAVLGDEMRCVHYDRLTSGGPSGRNWSRGSRFANDALCSNHVGVTIVWGPFYGKTVEPLK
jgi:hypothetical protein